MIDQHDYKVGPDGGAWLAQSTEHATLHLRSVSLSPTLDTIFFFSKVGPDSCANRDVPDVLGN